MNIVEELQQLSKTVFYLEERYARMQSSLYSCGSKIITVMHQGKEIIVPKTQSSIRTDKLADDVINLIDLENELSICKQKINSIITRLESHNLRKVLHQRYLLNMTTKEMAAEWNNTQRWIQMLLKQAEGQLLEQFESK